MTDMDNNIEHANDTNPCQGVCVIDNEFCIACMRTSQERAKWYEFTDAEREAILKEIKTREEGLFDEN